MSVRGEQVIRYADRGGAVVRIGTVGPKYELVLRRGS